MTGEKLYTPQLLGLATQLSTFPYTGERPLNHEARSQTCGSMVKVELSVASNQTINAIGMQVQACAVGQAAAAIMGKGAIGKAHIDLAEAYSQIEQWLLGAAISPTWPSFEPLLPVLKHKGRHGALLLPWRSALGALSLAETPS